MRPFCDALRMCLVSELASYAKDIYLYLIRQIHVPNTVYVPNTVLRHILLYDVSEPSFHFLKSIWFAIFVVNLLFKLKFHCWNLNFDIRKNLRQYLEVIGLKLLLWMFEHSLSIHIYQNNCSNTIGISVQNYVR